MARLSRFTVDIEATPTLADPASELVILEVGQPYGNHNGGAVRFGPDGMLYVSVGDGGSGGDPQGNGQNLETLLGTVIRIDVRAASESEPYAIPPDNPFVDVEGARPEIWAYGLRNPWRMAFDHTTGTLWLGDVGQDDLEEVDRIERGGNYGWNVLEGSACYFEDEEGGGAEAEGADEERLECDAVGMVLPVAEYPHSLGCAVSGGVVYRGTAIEDLAGSYLFGDFCSGRIWALAPGADEAVEIARADRGVAAFGTDAEGGVYVVTFDGSGGEVLRLEP